MFAGLTYEAWSFHLQLPDLTDLALAFPTQTIICDHISHPLGIGSFAKDYGWDGKTADEWRAGMTELAKCPNVYVKLGGQTQPHAGHNFHLRPKPPTSKEVAATIGPWLNYVIDAFGADRCMFESNFPPDKASCSYTILWNTFKRIALDRGCSSAEMAALFGGTAKKVYSLEGAQL